MAFVTFASHAESLVDSSTTAVAKYFTPLAGGLPPRHPFLLRVNDLFRSEGRLCRVIRVSECAAVVLMNQPDRIFTTRFDRAVKFRQPPTLFRISPNAQVQILNRPNR
jgi:hypothetical protein